MLVSLHWSKRIFFSWKGIIFCRGINVFYILNTQGFILFCFQSTAIKKYCVLNAIFELWNFNENLMENLFVNVAVRSVKIVKWKFCLDYQVFLCAFSFFKESLSVISLTNLWSEGCQTQNILFCLYKIQKPWEGVLLDLGILPLQGVGE